MKRVLIPIVALAIVAAAHSARAKDDPSGEWKWQFMFNGNSIDMSLKLKLDGDKLTGTLTSPRGETEIKDGQFKDGEVSFKTVRKGQDGQEFTTNYSGKLSGDTIKGKAESERNGQKTSRDWEAKKS
jgi:hypothetical protein